MIKEKDLQELLIRALNNYEFKDMIKNGHEYVETDLTYMSDNNIHSMQINDILYKKYKSNVIRFLDELDYDIRIVSGESIRNISLDCRERLYPDIVVYNEVSLNHYIFELKISRLTERESITELMAYIQEVKNYLPFLDNECVRLVIVSTEFRPIVKHSVASLILNNYSVICLKPIFGENGMSLEIIDVESWTDISISKLSMKAFCGNTLCLYGKSEKCVKHNDVINDIKVAIEYLKYDGNMIGSHGFCTISPNNNANGLQSITTTDYKVIVYVINPYNIYYRTMYRKNNNVFSNHLKEIVEDSDSRYYHDCSFPRLIRGFKKYLSDKYTVHYEGPLEFNQYYSYFVKEELPIYCDVWGEVGNFIRNLMCDQYLKKNLLPQYSLNYREPYIFFRLLFYLTNDYPFSCTATRCNDYLEFGVLIGEYIELFDNLEFMNTRTLFEIKAARILCSLHAFDVHLNLQLSNAIFEKVKKNELPSIADLMKYIKVFISKISKNSIEERVFFIGKNYHDLFETKRNRSCDDKKRISIIKNSDIYPDFIDLLINYVKMTPNNKIAGDIYAILFEVSKELHDYEFTDLNDFVKHISSYDLQSELLNIESDRKVHFTKCYLGNVLSYYNVT